MVNSALSKVYHIFNVQLIVITNWRYRTTARPPGQMTFLNSLRRGCRPLWASEQAQDAGCIDDHSPALQFAPTSPVMACLAPAVTVTERGNVPVGRRKSIM